MYLDKVIVKDWNMDTVAYISNTGHWSQSPLYCIFSKSLLLIQQLKLGRDCY